jgi:MFS family permease
MNEKNIGTTPKEMFVLAFGVFLGFLTMGLPLPILPLYVTGVLLWSPFVAGFVIGIQSLVTLVTRMYAGRLADTKGARNITIWGFIISACSGLIYWISSCFSDPVFSLSILMLGRLLLGVGESMLISGAMSWGIGLFGKNYSAQVISWVGLAMYGALAFGAPLGMYLFKRFDFSIVSLSVIVAPFLGMFVVRSLPKVSTVASSHMTDLMSSRDIFSRVCLPGFGMALGAVGFALLASFMSLYYDHRGWSGAFLGLTVFGVMYMIMRLFFINTIQKFGPNRVLMVVLVLEALGQVFLWLAPSPHIALIGAGLTGMGYSLVLPSFGAEVVKRVDDYSRGAALGAYTAFFDLALGLTGPIVGWIIAKYTLELANVFLVGILSSSAAFLIAYGLHRKES